MLIDPWHLAAVLEGFRLQLTRGSAGSTAAPSSTPRATPSTSTSGWCFPDFDQEGEVQQAETHLAGVAAAGDTPLLAAARGVHAWLDGRRDAARRSARRWCGSGRAKNCSGRRCRSPAPPRCAPRRRSTPSAWLPAFLQALAAEAADGRQAADGP